MVSRGSDEPVQVLGQTGEVIGPDQGYVGQTGGGKAIYI